VNCNKLGTPDRENVVTLNVSGGEAGSVRQLDPFGELGGGRRSDESRAINLILRDYTPPYYPVLSNFNT
jgi:hypothetical protein